MVVLFRMSKRLDSSQRKLLQNIC